VKREKLGAFELVLAMLLSGSIGVFVTASKQSATNVAFFRCLIAFGCLLPYCLVTGKVHRSFFEKRVLLPVSLSGIALVGNWVLLFKAYPLITIGLATTVYHINPFFVIFGSAILFKQSISAKNIMWTAVALVGLALAVGVPNGLNRIDTNEAVGILFTIAAAALYACTILLSRLTIEVPPAFIVLVQTFVGAALLLPGVDLKLHPALSREWWSIAILGVLHTFFLYCLVFSAYRKLSVNSIAVLSFIYPLSAIGFDYLAYTHRINLVQWFGIALILFSIMSVKVGLKPMVAWRRICTKAKAAN
jgi:drug/metabolite transporter (DMT)-like permease